MVKKLCLVWVSLLLFISSFSQSHEWKLDKDENGIKVYTRPIEGFPVDELRTETVVHAPMAAILAVIMDADNYEEWVFACSESRLVEKISDAEQYQYQVTDVPWPVTDRDVASHFLIKQDEKTKVVTVTNTGEPNHIPPKEDRVRVQHFQSNYKFTPLTNGKVKVEFELFVDPGGNVPAWLINSNIVTAPYKTTEAMVKLLPSFQTATLPFIKEN